MPTTITQTEVKVYQGTTTSGSQVGSTITKVGSPSSVNLDTTELGVALQAGRQYCAVARCTNSDGYTTDWTAAYPFKTLILAEINDLQGGNGAISPEILCTYDGQVISVASCGVYLSTNASGAGATKYSTDEQDAAQGWIINGLTENTTYYAVPFVIDNLNREYVGDWSEADSANTSYAAPTVTVTNLVATSSSISGNLNVSTNDTLSSVYIDVWNTGGSTHYRINKTATTGQQSFTVSNGDLDQSGATIVISPSTEYRITVYAVNTSGATGSGQATVTTASQVTSTISITGIGTITPTSAVASLTYGTGE